MKKLAYDPIADQLHRWHIEASTPRVRRCFARVLKEMALQGVYVLRTPKLQVVMLPPPAPLGMAHAVWAYFPIYKSRWIVRKYKLKLQPGVKVLLAISERAAEKSTEKEMLGLLAHHFGHTLLYLQAPRRTNECEDADKVAREFGLIRFLGSQYQLRFNRNGRRRKGKV